MEMRRGRSSRRESADPTSKTGIDLIAQLTTSERRQSAIILLVLGMAGLAMAALGRSDPLGVHGLLVILFSVGLSYFVLSSFYEPEPETDRLGLYYDDRSAASHGGPGEFGLLLLPALPSSVRGPHQIGVSAIANGAAGN